MANRTANFEKADSRNLPQVDNVMKFMTNSSNHNIAEIRVAQALMYRSDLVYQMGVMYGYLLELRFKSDNCLATMSKFNYYHFKFARFLSLYERLLTIHVDFTNSLERMFLLQAEIHKPTTAIVTTTASSEETT